MAALYGSWVPSGFAKGIERYVVISKGHCSLALYSLYVELGILSENDLLEFAKPGSPLQAHPEASRLPGLVCSTGSLGYGLSVANGLAIASRIDGVRREIAVLLGDGELDEGEVWEAAATASALGLENVIAIVDRNWFQHTGPTEKVKRKEPLGNKWRAFGWRVVEVDGCSVKMIVEALTEAGQRLGRPAAIIVYSRKRLA